MAIPYKKVLVPVDGSQNSFAALNHATEIAAACGAELGILYVNLSIQQLPLAADLHTVYLSGTLIEQMQQFSDFILAEAAKKVPDSITVHTFYREGVPTNVIPAFAEQHNYDIIVIGSRGLGLVKGIIMGSVSSSVVANAKCPVLVVK